MESFGTNCAIAKIPCGHAFHEACIKRWHSAENNCSLCRKRFKAEEISKLFMSENESALRDTNIAIKYVRKILDLKKEIRDLNVDKLTGDKSELNLENLRLKGENLRLEQDNLKLHRDYKIQNDASLELQEENHNLSTKLQDLKSHERNVQKTLRDALDKKKKQNKKNLIKFIDASNNLIDKQFELDMQISETKKAESEIKALQAKYLTWVPSYQISKRSNKRKQQLQLKSATIKSPPNKKKKEPAEEFNAPVSTPEYTPTSIRISRSCSSSSSLRSGSSSRSPIRYVQDDTLIPNRGQSRSRSRSSSSSSSNSSSCSTLSDSDPKSPKYTSTLPHSRSCSSSLRSSACSSSNPSSPRYSCTNPQYTPTWPRSSLRSSSGSSASSSSYSFRSSSSSYSRTSTQYSPNSPQYSPPSLGYSPTSPQYSPNSPAYSPTNPSYSPTSPEYTPKSQTYSPTSPSYSPTPPQYTLTSATYSPSSPSYSPDSPPDISDS